MPRHPDCSVINADGLDVGAGPQTDVAYPATAPWPPLRSALAVMDPAAAVDHDQPGIKAGTRGPWQAKVVR
ncbi:hypothetical protein GCM10023153_34370 [Ornithinibacter aureus]|uniref:Uncharacterized protein n=1 Tax=Ornithinibacter aureus TaxID=622664 RepID=A0ABP8KCM0_9MICO